MEGRKAGREGRRKRGRKEGKEEGRREGEEGGGRKGRRGQLIKRSEKMGFPVRAFQRNKTNSITHYASNFIKKFISSCSSNQLKELVISKSIGQAGRLESQAVVNAIIWRENLLFFGQISLLGGNAFN